MMPHDVNPQPVEFAGIGPDGNPATFKFAEGRFYANVCPDCGESNGGGIEDAKHPAGWPFEKGSPLKVPCLWCGKGPMVVQYADEEPTWEPGCEMEQLEREAIEEAERGETIEMFSNEFDEYIKQRREEDLSDKQAIWFLRAFGVFLLVLVIACVIAGVLAHYE